MNKNKHHMNIGATESFTPRIMEANKGIDHRDVKRSTNDCFVFGSWFASKKLE